jgi:NAD(P)H-dependent flavin oxidoreductase YrpB (nitropropane dioxygenase family)
MGVGVSNWKLANAVARLGQLGVVSGTGLDTLFVRRLQDGDPGGHLRRAIERFPLWQVGSEVLTRYFRPEGRRPGTPYKALAMYDRTVNRMREQVTVLANFVEVFLAREGHDGPVGINLLTKIQMPNLASLYGAMLAGVDYVLMGAGIPREIPGALDALAEHGAATQRLELEGEPRDAVTVTFDPAALDFGGLPSLRRPRFLPIIASNSLATMLSRRANGRLDGFVIEGPTAGGHNAPPRGEKRFNQRGEPLYGERDVVSLERIAELGLPFWLAGGHGSPEGLEQAQAAGAAGVQVGSLFAFCDESGLSDSLKRRALDAARRGETEVVTDDRASPTGFPFKVVQLAGTLSEEASYQARRRTCDLGYLRVAYRTAEDAIGYRCSAEPVEKFIAKGGELAEAAGRKCLCNALLSSIGHGQERPGGKTEPPLLTSGDQLTRLPRYLLERGSYTAAEVVAFVLSSVTSGAGAPLAVPS